MKSGSFSLGFVLEDFATEGVLDRDRLTKRDQLDASVVFLREKLRQYWPE